MLRPDRTQVPCAMRMARFVGVLLSVALCCQIGLAQQLRLPLLFDEAVVGGGSASGFRPPQYVARLLRLGAATADASAMENSEAPGHALSPPVLSGAVGLRSVWGLTEQAIRDESDTRSSIEFEGFPLPLTAPRLWDWQLSAHEVGQDDLRRDLAFWFEGPTHLLTCDRVAAQSPSVWDLMQVGDQVADWSFALPGCPAVLAMCFDEASRSGSEWRGDSSPPPIPRVLRENTETSTWSPRVHVSISRIYDNDGATGGIGAFERLFQIRQSDPDYGDLGGREPVYNISVGTSVQTTRAFTLSASVHWLRSEAELGPGQGSMSNMMRLPDLSAWPDIGAELDISLNYRIGNHSSLLLGYGRFFASDFTDENGPLQDVDFVYATVQITF